MCNIDRLVVLEVVLIIALIVELEVVQIHLFSRMYSIFLKVDECQLEDVVCQLFCTDADGTSSSTSRSNV